VKGVEVPNPELEQDRRDYADRITGRRLPVGETVTGAGVGGPMYRRRSTNGPHTTPPQGPPRPAGPAPDIDDSDQTVDEDDKSMRRHAKAVGDEIYGDGPGQVKPGAARAGRRPKAPRQRRRANNEALVAEVNDAPEAGLYPRGQVAEAPAAGPAAKPRYEVQSPPEGPDPQSPAMQQARAERRRGESPQSAGRREAAQRRKARARAAQPAVEGEDLSAGEIHEDTASRMHAEANKRMRTKSARRAEASPSTDPRRDRRDLKKESVEGRKESIQKIREEGEVDRRARQAADKGLERKGKAAPKGKVVVASPAEGLGRQERESIRQKETNEDVRELEQKRRAKDQHGPMGKVPEEKSMRRRVKSDEVQPRKIMGKYGREYDDEADKEGEEKFRDEAQKVADVAETGPLGTVPKDRKSVRPRTKSADDRKSKEDKEKLIDELRKDERTAVKSPKMPSLKPSSQKRNKSAPKGRVTQASQPPLSRQEHRRRREDAVKESSERFDDEVQKTMDDIEIGPPGQHEEEKSMSGQVDHREACREAARFLHGLAGQQAGLFGDPHRTQAQDHFKALEGLGLHQGGGADEDLGEGEDGDYPGVEMEDGQDAPGMEGLGGDDFGDEDLDESDLDEEDLDEDAENDLPENPDSEEDEEDEDFDESERFGEAKEKSLLRNMVAQQQQIDRLTTTIRGLSAALGR
jgi:hypothetical protein